METEGFEFVFAMRLKKIDDHVEARFPDPVGAIFLAYSSGDTMPCSPTDDS